MSRPNEKPKKREGWPRIKKINLRGATRYMLDCRISGKGERLYFATRAEAEGEQITQRTRRQNEGHAAFDNRELAEHGWTVAMAIKFAVDHLRKQKKSVPLTEAINRLEASKLASGKNPYYCRLMRQRLEKMLTRFPARNVGEITTEELEVFLNSLNVAPATRNTIRRDMVTLWSYCVKTGLASSNEAQKVDATRTPDNVPEILTLDEAKKLLDASTGDVQVFHAIGLFAGLRVSEIERLCWEQVDFQSGYIHVMPAIQRKSRSRRLVPILDNLRSWLLPHASSEGRIIGVNFTKRRIATLRSAGWGTPGRETEEEKAAQIGLIPWPENGLRHSFVSYRLADTNNAAQTALESGHGQTILFRHYRELVSTENAKKYFLIMPEADQSI